MATTYLYSVSPKKPIRFLCGVAVVPPIRTPRSLQLTLDQVKECIKYGSVYRRFAEEGINERVNTVNVERLHNAHYISEEEFNSLSTNVAKVEEIKPTSKVEENKRGQVEISEDIYPTTIMASEDDNEDLKEELVEETEVEDSSNDEIVEDEESTEESIDEEVEDSIQDEELEEDIVDEETTSTEEEASDRTESYSNKNSYNYNNKNRNKKNRH